MCTSQCSSICVRPQAAWVPTKMLDVHQNWVCPQKPRLPAGSCVDLLRGQLKMLFSFALTQPNFADKNKQYLGLRLCFFNYFTSLCHMLDFRKVGQKNI